MTKKLKPAGKGIFTVRVPLAGVHPGGQRAFEDAAVDAELMIDADAIMEQMAPRAAKNSNWRSTLLRGALVVRVRVRRGE